MFSPLLASRAFRVPGQVALFVAAFALLSIGVQHLGWHIGSAPLGFAVLLLALATRIVPIRAVDEGAQWLLAKSGVFLIPPVVAIARERQLFESHWAALLIIIVGGTVLTTAATAFAVEWTCNAMMRKADNAMTGKASA